MGSAAGLEPKLPAVLRRPACAAASALGLIGQEGLAYAAQVAEIMDDSDARPEVIAECARALGLMRAEESEERLRTLLENQSPIVREAACFALGSLSLDSENSLSVDDVAARLWDPHPAVRQAAATAIGHMRFEGSRYLDDLVQLFGDRVAAVQAAAVRAVGCLGYRGQFFASKVAQLAMDGQIASRI